MTDEAWRQYLQTYVALRRATGFSMQREERLLQDFVEHLERRGHDAPVAPVAVEWASASTESQRAGRLSIVRGFLTMVPRRRARRRRARRRAGSHVQTSYPAHPRARRDRCSDGCRPLPRSAQCAASAHRRHRDRAAGELWPPRRRGDSPRHRSRRSRWDSAMPGNPEHQVPEVAPRTAPSHDRRRAAGLRRATPGSRLRRRVQRLLRLRTRRQTPLPCPCPDVRTVGPPARPARASRHPRASACTSCATASPWAGSPLGRSKESQSAIGSPRSPSTSATSARKTPTGI